MIDTCKQYITCRNTQPIWGQDRVQICQKLNDCIRLNSTYHDTYTLIQRQPMPTSSSADTTIAVQFKFSENYVFGKFDSFCRRLQKIISLFDLIDDYNGLFERRMEGTRLFYYLFIYFLNLLYKNLLLISYSTLFYYYAYYISRLKNLSALRIYTLKFIS